MHAVIVTLSIQPGKIEEVLGLYRDVGGALLKQQPGFKAINLLRGSDPDKLVAVVLWETKANIEAWENSGDYREYRGKMADVLAGPNAIEGYEVAFQA